MRLFNADWSFVIQGWIKEAVESRYRSDLHRWPILSSFDADIYQCGSDVRLFILRDKSPGVVMPSFSGQSAKPWPIGIDEPSDPLTTAGIRVALAIVYERFDLRQQDVAFYVPWSESLGPNMDADYDSMWTQEIRHVGDIQVGVAVLRQLHYVRGFDQVGEFLLPPGYTFLAPECERFLRDHPNYDRNVFLMTRFDSSSRALVELDTEVRRVLREHDLNPLRADDKMYMQDRNLWNNVCVYMLCSSRGVAILEDRGKDEFNPNVALEYGFMRALNRPALLLTDRSFRNLRADVVGTLREEFDITEIDTSVKPAIERWLVLQP